MMNYQLQFPEAWPHFRCPPFKADAAAEVDPEVRACDNLGMCEERL